MARAWPSRAGWPSAFVANGRRRVVASCRSAPRGEASVGRGRARVRGDGAGAAVAAASTLRRGRRKAAAKAARMAPRPILAAQLRARARCATARRRARVQPHRLVGECSEQLAPRRRIAARFFGARDPKLDEQRSLLARAAARWLGPGARCASLARCSRRRVGRRGAARLGRSSGASLHMRA